MPRTDTLAIDFGTSNTAASLLRDGTPHFISLEAQGDTMPTAVFLDFHRRQTLVGEAAIAALVSGREGRFMRALKSVLGTSLLHEKRQFLNERLTLSEVIIRFLSQVKARAEADCGQAFPRVLSGRPVHFHSRDPERDARALADLTACYHAAGFTEVDFLFEPAAAALAAAEAGGGLGLIVDIGGGTSDFSLFRRTDGATEVIASHGIRLGGTDFDRQLSLTYVMPLLGKGTGLKAEIGPKVHDAPVALFHDLASWEKIPFLYTAPTRRDVARMAKLAVEPVRFNRLVSVLENELGHDIAFAVERGKILANGEDGQGVIDLGLVEAGLALGLSGHDLSKALIEDAERIGASAAETLEMANVPPEAVERIVLVGGSSLLTTVSQAVQAQMPQARLTYSAAFTAVAHGLAIAAAQ